ncbi:aminoacyl-tRNA deacylase [Desulfopila inferna]|uniref:aminoacyl-tRNA deacylase n=1 Tax=Desulfopila inferna TaxID=468528 RepID=UPI001965D4CD|nr:YbaK/EbsC family protein [Desulfopila inferna]MBM9606108.1 YbaK/EbsC family protein [Desulfopila inferna]
MTVYSRRLQDWLHHNNVKAELLSFDKSVHSVEEAVAVSGYPVERITKSIVMLTAADDTIVIAMVPASKRVSTERVRKYLQLKERPLIADAELIEKRIGQQAGGNSPLSAGDAIILLDPELLQMDWILTGGGDDRHLVKISIEELRKAVPHKVTRVRK